MKARLLFFFLVYALGFVAHAQLLSQKTNSILVNTKNTNLPESGPLPVIRWISPSLDFTANSDHQIEVEASLEVSQEIQEIKLELRSGTDASLMAKKSIPVVKGQNIYRIKQQLYLPDGSNKLQIVVVTASGVSVSDHRTVLIGTAAEDNLVASNRKDFALIIATDKYDHWDDLVNPIDDGRAIGKELQEKYGFQVEFLENPTVEQVWEKLRMYSEMKFNPQDQLLIFFAGHGHYDEAFGEGFVVAKNSLRNDVSKTTYLSHNRLRGVIANIPSKHTLLAMDVCFGGTLDPVLARSRASTDNEVSVNEMLVRKFRYRTRKYLTSGGKVYVSDGIPGKHSPFAERLIESLRTLGTDDGVLTLSEMQSSLEKLKQQPRFGSFGDDEALSDFVFVRKLK
jgi:hypothetical protein